MEPVTGAAAAQSVRPLTDQQQQALSKLHQAAQQMESLFVDMLFKEMRKSSPSTSLTGPKSNAEETFESMLDEKRAEELSKSGSLGLGKILEQELRGAVLANPGTAASARVRQESDL
ncbi:MAG TPA: rod-binding protein [Candidatus Elarobacter sp.]|jgi:Rod binding domain-containing protein|nr:rod-binding protein [Candidatus Elarobacter sp.]